MSTEKEPFFTKDPIMLWLAPRRFSAATVCSAAKINATSLTNILNKTVLELCTKSNGRGGKREFCLLDCYLIHLMNMVSKKVRNYDDAARKINHLAYEFVRQQMLSGNTPFRNDKSMKEYMISHFREWADPVFTHRSGDNPWIIVEGSDGLFTATLNTEKDNINTHIIGMVEPGLVLNITHALAELDRELARYEGFDLTGYQKRAQQLQVSKLAAEVMASVLAQEPDEKKDDDEPD